MPPNVAARSSPPPAGCSEAGVCASARSAAARSAAAFSLGAAPARMRPARFWLSAALSAAAWVVNHVGGLVGRPLRTLMWPFCPGGRPA
eukprot:scaffold75513_cov56-Phaeocystis_antarctica.AAC.1